MKEYKELGLIEMPALGKELPLKLRFDLNDRQLHTHSCHSQP
jgi:hypothetical protein